MEPDPPNLTFMGIPIRVSEDVAPDDIVVIPDGDLVTDDEGGLEYVSNYSIDADGSNFLRVDNDGRFEPVVAPIHQVLTVTLPSGDALQIDQFDGKMTLTINGNQIYAGTAEGERVAIMELPQVPTKPLPGKREVEV